MLTGAAAGTKGKEGYHRRRPETDRPGGGVFILIKIADQGAKRHEKKGMKRPKKSRPPLPPPPKNGKMLALGNASPFEFGGETNLVME